MHNCVLIAGDFNPWGGMDRANYELAWHLAERESKVVHLVAHEVAPPLSVHPNVVWHRVGRPWGRHALAEPLLRWRGRIVASAQPDARVVVNGGNCVWPDVNWIHAVHAAWDRRDAHAPLAFRFRAALVKRAARASERRAVRAARLIITNSARAREQIVAGAGIRPELVTPVYYGIDPSEFRPASAEERSAARREFGLPQASPIVCFIGALGHDRNKGFDVVFEAWRQLCREASWDVDLVAAGAGAELEPWRACAEKAGLSSRVRLLGFTRRVSALLAASDALVSPTHYDAYGLGVQEALACGLPAFVTRSAGVAERYPAELQGLLLGSPPSAEELCRRLRAWRSDMASWRGKVSSFGASIRARTWADMSRDIVALLSRGPQGV